MKRLLTRQGGHTRSFAGRTVTFQGCLRLVTIQVYWTDAQSWLGSGADFNIMSLQIMKQSLAPDSTKKHITVADCKTSPCVGVLGQVPVHS